MSLSLSPLDNPGVSKAASPISILPTELLEKALSYVPFMANNSVVSKAFAVAQRTITSTKIYDAYLENSQVRRFMPPVFLLLSRVLTRDQVVELTYRAFMRQPKIALTRSEYQSLWRVDEAAFDNLQKVNDVDIDALAKTIEDINFVRCFGRFVQAPAEAGMERPLFERGYAQRAEPMRDWLEMRRSLEHEALENDQILIPADQLVLNQDYLPLETLSLTAIPREINSFGNLEHLDLMGNKISDLSDLPPIPSLLYLNLSGNQITSLQGMPLLPRLLKLFMDENQIEDVGSMPLHPSLQELYLHENRINNLRQLPPFPNLQFLGAGGNQITDLHMPLLPNLRQAYLGENQITTLQHMPLHPNLHELRLNNNQLADEVIPPFPNLLNLELSNNGLTRMPLLPNLQGWINLQDNQITHLRWGTFPNNRLYFSENPVEDKIDKYQNSGKWLDYYEMFDPRTMPCSARAKMVALKGLDHLRNFLAGPVGRLLS